jgi:hypothetical protein
MRHLDIRNEMLQRPLERFEAGGRVRNLTGLVIFAAEDEVIEFPLPIDAQVVIRICRVPEAGFRHRSALDLPANHVARIQRELGLEQ